MRRSTRTVTRVLTSKAAVVVAAAMGDCSSGGYSLVATRSQFLPITTNKQLHLASEWGKPDQDHVSDAATPGFQDDLISCCEQPGHGEDQLQNIEMEVASGVQHSGSDPA